jgi:predicted nucleic acid-binding protein
MKVYLDTNVASSLARGDNLAEKESLRAILQAFKKDRVQLVTSPVMKSEIDQCTGPHRQQIETIYFLLKDVPLVVEERHTGFHSSWHDELGATSDPAYDTDIVWAELRKIGLDHIDAYHVMLAIRDKCDVFLTCDEATILNRRQEIELAFAPIQLMKPSDLVPLLLAA